MRKQSIIVATFILLALVLMPETTSAATPALPGFDITLHTGGQQPPPDGLRLWFFAPDLFFGVRTVTIGQVPMTEFASGFLRDDGVFILTRSPPMSLTTIDWLRFDNTYTTFELNVVDGSITVVRSGSWSYSVISGPSL